MGLRRCKLSKKVQLKLLEYFVLGVTAHSAADLLGIQANTAALFYHKLRDLIAYQLDEACPVEGEIELDESYFGGQRKGKRGRGAAGKVPVFGLLKRGGKVYAKMIPNASRETLLPIIKRHIIPDSIVYTDSWPAYDTLDVSGFQHHRINHSETFAEDRKKHINGIENFWNQAKRHLRRYNGVPRQHFGLFLKECEFRFNYGSPSQQLQTLKRWANFP